MKYTYGSGLDEVDRFFEKKRSWSKVKDKIVSDYIECYLKTVHNLKRPILIVDGFAGPGRFGDGTDGSPLLICKAISERARGRARCLFADAHPGHRRMLQHALAEFTANGIADVPYGECAEAVSHALGMGSNSTVFFYLDPYGIKDLEFDMVRQIYERSAKQSTEVLINFNFRTFMRMSGNWKYIDSADEVSRKVKQSKTEKVNMVMGGDYWQSIIINTKLGKIERENEVINAYLERLRQFFTYAHAIPVKERKDEEYGVPDDELARYHLIFGTRSARAVVYMNDVALNALEPYFRQFKDGLLFDLTPERYQSIDRNRAKCLIVDAVSVQPLRRQDIYEAVIPKLFMHYRKKDYKAMIDELAVEGRLYPDQRTLKRKNQLNDETLLSAKAWSGFTFE